MVSLLFQNEKCVHKGIKKILLHYPEDKATFMLVYLLFVCLHILRLF